jgi:hypothetical protein
MAIKQPNCNDVTIHATILALILQSFAVKIINNAI